MLAILTSHDRGARVTLANIKNYVPSVHGKDHRIAEYSDLPNPRIFRDEYPVHADLYPKTVYLIRDPRAVLVSLYHMYRIECNDPDMSMATFMDDYLHKHGCFQRWNRGLMRWDRQVGLWTERAAHDRRVLLIRYEQMVRDRCQVLEQVAKFAGITYDADQLQAVHNRSAFDAMQEEEDRYGSEAYSGAMATRGRFIRRGKVDGWKQELDAALVRRIEREFEPIMKATDYLT